MKTTFEDFEKTALYANLVKDFELAIKTAFLVGHQLGLDEARAILNGKKE